jgi:hypothetical protein
LLYLSLYAAGQCRTGGRMRVPVQIVNHRGRDWRGPVHYVTYPLSISCDQVARQLARRVAPVNGGPAYQDPWGGIYWEYGRNAWASLHPGISPYYSGPMDSALNSWLTGPPAVQQSAANWQLVRQVASRLRFDQAPAHPVYGFTLTGLPASWGTGYPGGLAMLNGRRASPGWTTTGPAADPGALGIFVWPAPGQTPGEPPLRCNFVPGQSSYITVDGVQAMLRIMDQVGKHWQSLCIPDVDGLTVYMVMDVWSEGSDDKPLPGWPSQGVLAVFEHMHLLGPDVANWTTNPQK